MAMHLLASEHFEEESKARTQSPALLVGCRWMAPETFSRVRLGLTMLKLNSRVS